MLCRGGGGGKRQSDINRKWGNRKCRLFSVVAGGFSAELLKCSFLSIRRSVRQPQQPPPVEGKATRLTFQEITFWLHSPSPLQGSPPPPQKPSTLNVTPQHKKRETTEAVLLRTCALSAAGSGGRGGGGGAVGLGLAPSPHNSRESFLNHSLLLRLTWDTRAKISKKEKREKEGCHT